MAFSGRLAHFESVLYAFRGDRETALAIADKYDDGSNAAAANLLWTYHILGEDERLISLLTRIDSEPLGPLSLAPYVFSWAGTLPFDLADAPNFTERLLEAGVDINSLETIDWPDGN